jgi:hypothetical protein
MCRVKAGNIVNRFFEHTVVRTQTKLVPAAEFMLPGVVVFYSIQWFPRLSFIGSVKVLICLSAINRKN